MLLDIKDIAGIQIVKHCPEDHHKVCPMWCTWLAGLSAGIVWMLFFILPYNDLSISWRLGLIFTATACSALWVMLLPVRTPERYQIMRTVMCSDNDWNKLLACYDVEHVDGDVYLAQPKYERNLWNTL